MLRTIVCLNGFVLAALGVPAIAEDAKPPEVQQVLKRLEGTWRVTELVVNGDEADKEEARKLTIVNGADGRWVVRQEDREIARGRSTFNPGKTPAEVDFEITDGESKGERREGIYEIGEKTRKLCFANPGYDRPTEFYSRPGSQRTLVVLERVERDE